MEDPLKTDRSGRKTGLSVILAKPENNSLQTIE
jgi:hypothetical protein